MSLPAVTVDMKLLNIVPKPPKYDFHLTAGLLGGVGAIQIMTALFILYNAPGKAPNVQPPDASVVKTPVAPVTEVNAPLAPVTVTPETLVNP